MERYVYEVINFSDDVTFEVRGLGSDEADEVAILCVLVLGRGVYGATRGDGKDVLPILAFCSEQKIHEAIEALGVPRGGLDHLGHEVEAHAAEMVAALRSSAVCSVADRKAMITAIGDDPEAIQRWNEVKRTSTNDICGNAHALADSLEARYLRGAAGE